MDRGMTVGYFARNERGVPEDEAYGIEIEAENYSRERWPVDARAMSKHWNLVEDGSLRNSGVEFVSKPLSPGVIEQAVRHLYARTAAYWQPSVRTGIHVHANVLGRTFEELRRIFSYYSFIEPVLFHMLGAEREENIYCVPWYRAPEEAENAVRTVMRDPYSAREACKYSALFVGPIQTYGTIEFRHAPTFIHPDALLGWISLCRTVANSYTLPDPIETYAAGGVAAVINTLLPDFDMLSMEDMEGMIEDTGAAEIALTFQPCTYKAVPWGKPGEFVTKAGDEHRSITFSSRIERAQLDAILRATEPPEEERLEDLLEDHDNDDEEEQP